MWTRWPTPSRVTWPRSVSRPSDATSKTWGFGPRWGRKGRWRGIQYYSWGSNSIFDADAILYALTYSKEPLSYTKDPALDQFLDDGRTSIDPKKRQEAYAKAQKLLHDKYYWIPVNVQYTIEGVSKKLNYEAGSDEMMRVYGASWKE